MSYHRLKLEGRKIGKLTVVKATNKDRFGHYRFLCQCECGNQKEILGTHLTRELIKSCGCDSTKSGNRHHQWGGVGDISAGWWYNKVLRHRSTQIKQRKNRENIEVTITMQYAWELFQKQGGKCALTGLPLKIAHKGTASIDRIDCAKGYIEGNIQWVHKNVNTMKNIFSQQYFINVCNLIAQKHPIENVEYIEEARKAVPKTI